MQARSCIIAFLAPRLSIDCFNNLQLAVITTLCVVEARAIFASTEKNRLKQKNWFQQNYESVLTELNSV